MAPKKSPRRDATRKSLRTKNASPRASGQNYLPSMEKYLTGLLTGISAGDPDLKPSLLIDLGLGFVMTDLLAHTPGIDGAGVCLTASHGLRAAYEWLGVTAQVVPCQLRVQYPNGSGTLYGAEFPSYDSRQGTFSGHCLTYLPDRQRLCDLTVAQFPEIRRADPSPMLGKAILRSDDNLRTFSDPRPGPLVDGQEFMVKRKDLVLSYVFLGASATEVVHTLAPRGCMDSATAMHTNFLNGLHATAEIVALTARDPGLTRAVQTLTEIPRFAALVEALQGATWDFQNSEPDEPDAFVLANGDRVLMRDLVLAAGTPGPLPQTPVKILTSEAI